MREACPFGWLNATEILLSKAISEHLQDLEKWMRYGGLNDTEQHSCSKIVKGLIRPIAEMENELKISEAREQDAYESAEIGFVATIEKLRKDVEHYKSLCEKLEKERQCQDIA